MTLHPTNLTKLLALTKQGGSSFLPLFWWTTLHILFRGSKTVGHDFGVVRNLAVLHSLFPFAISSSTLEGSVQYSLDITVKSLSRQGLQDFLHLLLFAAPFCIAYDQSLSEVLSALDQGRKGGTAEHCTFCNSLLDAVHCMVKKSLEKRDETLETGYAVEFITTLGTFLDTCTNSTCEEHKTLIKDIFRIDDDTHAGTPRGLGQEAKIQVNWDRVGRHMYLTATKDLKTPVGASTHFHAEFLLLAPESAPFSAPYIGRVRDDDFISTDLIKNWISTCEADHALTCGVAALPSTSLSWMIDTTNYCLVPALEGVRFVALSYVWGQIEMLKTETTNISALQEEGALRKPTSLGLPRVIKQAIALVPQLGERYLWVDSLCIVQDDSESLQRHIRHMASIYGAAIFTIVAADGLNADQGILGIKGVSESRRLSTATLPLTSRLSMRPIDQFDLTFTPWSRRGWTLQEHIFSRRKLVFVHGSVQWICQECRCFEDVHHAFTPAQKRTTPFHQRFTELESIADLILKYPSVSQLEELLWRYGWRYLTFQDDALKAVESIFTAHREAFPNGFFQGLPLAFFDMALLWHVHQGRRRSVSSQPPSLPFPSWTWAGWIGILQTGNWLSATYIKTPDETYTNQRKFLTIPMLEWSCRTNRDSSKSFVSGQNSAYGYKRMFMGKADGLPNGWKYKQEPFGPIARDDWAAEHNRHDENYSSNNWALTTPYYYSHEAAPGVKFWHPVPISSDSSSNTMFPIHGRFLCAKTQSGGFWVTGPKDDGILEEHELEDLQMTDVRLFSLKISVQTVLRDRRGKLVGDLYIDDRLDHDLVKEYECQPEEVGYPCELVAISKGNDFMHPMEPEKETYTFYNVLWIKWEDGIAYRRGVGRVQKETWESMELKDVDLVLG